MLKKFFLVISLMLGIASYVTGAPHIVVLSDGIVDLGEFEEKDIQTREIFIKNTGDEPLVIIKSFTNCSCTRLQYNPSPIAPGDSTSITVTFDGRRRKPGAIRKVFRLNTNADNPVVSVLVKGEIIRPFQK